jgi:hypothetical protein
MACGQRGEYKRLVPDASLQSDQPENRHDQEWDSFQPQTAVHQDSNVPPI